MDRKDFNQMWKMGNFGEDGADAAEIDALIMKMMSEEHGEASGEESKSGSDNEWEDDVPTADDVMTFCDADETGDLSKEEVHMCIDMYILQEAQPMHDMVNEHWQMIAGTDDVVDMDELNMVMGEVNDEANEHHHATGGDMNATGGHGPNNSTATATA
jgi:hypothetical protein